MKTTLRLAFLLCMTVLLLVVPAMAADIVENGTCGELSWTLDAEGLLTISGNGAIPDYNWENPAPWNIEHVQSVIIEEGVTAIGNQAFNNYYRMHTVTIPSSVTYIGNQAFEACWALTAIEVHTKNPAYQSVDGTLFSKDGKTLYQFPFAKSVIYSVPEGTAHIADRAFIYSPLEEIILPDSLVSIGTQAFWNNMDLTSLTLPKNLQFIGDSAFTVCHNLKAFIVDENNSFYQATDGVLYSKDGKTLVLYPSGNGNTYEIPQGVERIGTGAFRNHANLTSVSIPDSVTVIESGAFEYCTALTEITLPKNLTTIGSWAFIDCYQLTKITIPKTVTSIDVSAFAGCENLQEAYFLGNAPQYFGRNVFNGTSASFTIYYNEGTSDWTTPDWATTNGDLYPTVCLDENGNPVIPEVTVVANGICGDNLTWTLDSIGLLTISGTGEMYPYYQMDMSSQWNKGTVRKIVIEDGVTSIGNNAFSDCRNLTSVTIAESVNSIYDNAFGWCLKLESVTLPEHLEFISGSAFSGSETLHEIHIPSGNPHYQSIDGVLYSKDGKTLIICPGGFMKYSVPYGVEHIAEYAFARTILTDITLPNSLVSIGNYAFENAYRLNTITIPASVSVIGDGVFSLCFNLTEIIADPNSSYYKSIDGVLFSKDGKTLIAYPSTKGSSYAIPLGVERIGARAFQGCQDLVSVTIPDSVKVIDHNAFTDCANLTSVTIPDSVTIIDRNTFQNCRNLTSVALSKNLTTISSWAFGYCYQLTEITIPKTVTSIDVSAFARCESLKKAYFLGNAPQYFGRNVFNGASASFTIYYNEGTSGWTTPNWTTQYNETYTTVCLNENGNPTIPDTSVVANGTLGENISWTLDSDGLLTIAGYGDMPSLIKPSSAWNCRSIKTVVIEEGITSISSQAFYNCDNLTSVTLPNSLLSIGDNAFFSCDKLTSIQLPNNLKSIGNIAFGSCFTLQSLSIPASVTYIGESIVRYCYDLTEITVDKANQYFTAIDGVLFDINVTELYAYPIGNPRTEYQVPNGVSVIRQESFVACKYLTTITLPDSLTTIGYSAFYSNYFNTITIPFGVTYIGEDAFALSSTLSEIIVDPRNTCFTTVDGVLFDKNMTTLYTYPAMKADVSYRIPDGVTTISSRAFYECSALTSVTLPDSVTTIGYYAFLRCSGLTSITFPAGLESIGFNAFMMCQNLQKAYFLGNAPYIDQGAFNETSASFTIYYNEGTNGWTTPEWVSAGGTVYKAVCLDENGNPTIPEATVIASGICGDNLNWTLDSTGLLFVSGTGSIKNFDWNEETPWDDKAVKSIVIEEGVTGIGMRAFANCTNVTSIELADTITYIGEYAFQSCYRVTTIELPRDLVHLDTDIGFPNLESIECDKDNQAFCAVDGVLYSHDMKTLVLYPRNGYQHPVIPKTVTTIRERAFLYSHIHSITLPESLVTIEYQAFWNNQFLTSLTIPKNVSEIAECALTVCTKLEAFYVDPENQYFASKDGVLYNKDFTRLIAVPVNNGELIDCFVVPDGVTSIAEHAFHSSGLKSVKLPDTLTRIEYDAFLWCENLESVVIPQNVTSLQSFAFGRCENLKSATFEGNAPAEWISMVFEGASPDFIIYFYKGTSGWATPTWIAPDGTEYTTVCLDENGHPTIPETNGKCGDNLTWTLDSSGCLTISGTGAMWSYYDHKSEWWDNKAVMSIVIKDGVSSIGRNAFNQCRNVVSISIADSVVKIEDWALGWCEQMSSITLPQNLEYIGSYAFSGTPLTEIDIPATVTYIGDAAFSQNTLMTSINIHPNNQSYMFDDGVLYSKDGKLLHSFLESITAERYSVPEHVETIGDHAFYGCKVVQIVLHKNIVSIGYEAFANASQLAAIEVDLMNEYYSSIDGVLFTKDQKCLIICPRLKSGAYAIPQGTEIIGLQAFDSCYKLTSVTIPESVTIIEHAAFQMCYNLKEVIFLGDLPEQFGNSVFWDIIFGNKPTLYYYEGAKGFSTPTWTAPDGTVLETVMMERPEPEFLLGDINLDDFVDIRDAEALFMFSMLPELYPISYTGDIDFTDDGEIDIRDAQKLFQYSLLPDLYPIA